MENRIGIFTNYIHHVCWLKKIILHLKFPGWYLGSVCYLIYGPLQTSKCIEYHYCICESFILILMRFWMIIIVTNLKFYTLEFKKEIWK